MIPGYLYWCYTEVRAHHIADWLAAVQKVNSRHVTWHQHLCNMTDCDGLFVIILTLLFRPGHNHNNRTMKRVKISQFRVLINMLKPKNSRMILHKNTVFGSQGDTIVYSCLW